MPPRRRRFGRVRQLPSGRWQARYSGPDGIDRPAPQTFDRRADADRWLAKVEDDLIHGQWTDPELARVPLRIFAVAWLRERPNLRPKTVQLYEGLIRLHILPGLGDVTLGEVTPGRVRAWRAELLAGGLGTVTVAKAYRLLRTIMGTAVEDRLIRSNPCQIKGASTESIPERPVLAVAQVYALANGMPPRYRLLVLLATFCSLRWGEVAALRGRALDADRGLVHVRETVNELADGSLVIGPPKTDAGRRVVAIPAALLPDVLRHLDLFVGDDPDALVFAGPKGAVPRRSNFQKYWRAALVKADLPTSVHFHDLRHTGNTLTAQAGATLSDLMARMGHASTRAARIYLHTTSERDVQVAAALNRFLPTAQAAEPPEDDTSGKAAGATGT